MIVRRLCIRCLYGGEPRGAIILRCGARCMLGAHGPPVEGAQLISDSIIDSRDAIQYMWDQTVRGANQGLTLDQLVTVVQLPEHFKSRYQTQQFYGVVEHHVRQIYTGLFGWFESTEYV